MPVVGRRNRTRDRRSLHLMLLPAVIVLLIFSYGPMMGLVMAFQNFVPAKGFFSSQWVGLANFRYVFNLPNIVSVLRNTFFISINEIVLGQALAILLALVLNEAYRGVFTRTVQTVIYLPHFLSWVIIGGVFLDVLAFDGLANNALSALGLQPVYFLGTPRVFPWVLILTHLWKEVGFATIVYLAALSGIDAGLYEAAEIDGAGRVKRILHVTLPGILPTIVLVAILNLGSILNAGSEQVLVMYNMLVYSTGDILDTFVYRLGLKQNQYSIASAVGIFKSLVSLALVGGTYFTAYKVADYKIF